MDLSSKQVDRISNLPESILTRILSFLPARDASRTVLIKPFHELWTNIETLDFDDLPFFENGIDWGNDQQLLDVYERFTTFIRHFLILHKSPTLYKFIISFFLPLGVLESDNESEYPIDVEMVVSEVQMWVKFALSRDVKVLHLLYGDPNGACTEDNFILPSCIWGCSSLVELNLLDCRIGSLDQVPFRMGSLRVLALNKVNFSDEAITKVINDCPLLEDVSIADCFELAYLSFSNPNVKRLRVFAKYSSDDHHHHHWCLNVNCPNVRSFEYSGHGDCLEVFDLSSVEVATLGLRFVGSVEFLGFFELKRLLESVQHAEVLKLDQGVFTVLMYHVVQNHPIMCSKWKRLEFHTTMNGKFISGICSLLRYLSHLEELLIKVGDPVKFLPEEIKWELYDNGDVWENDWSSEFSIPNLKTVTMHGLFRSSFSAQIELVKVILKNAPVLDKVCIYTKGYAQPAEKNPLPSHRLFEISKKILTFPRASKQATVFLL